MRCDGRIRRPYLLIHTHNVLCPEDEKYFLVKAADAVLCCLGRAARQRHYVKLAEDLDYHQRRNRTARLSHTKTRITKLHALATITNAQPRAG